jgi:hypothetical protein
MVVRMMWYRFKKFTEHVKYMRGQAHGTLLADPEASFWGNLIRMPNYRPIWRWYYAKYWDDTGSKAATATAAPRKYKWVRRIAYLNLAVAIIVALILVMPGMLNIQLVPKVETATDLKVLGWSENLIFQYYIEDFGNVFSLLNTTRTSDYGQQYPGNWTALYFSLTRTDAAFNARNVVLNLTVGYKLGTDEPLALNVSWIVQNGDSAEQYDGIYDGSGKYFSLPISIESKAKTFAAVVVEIPPHIIGQYQLYYMLSVDSGGLDDHAAVFGGYTYNYRGT